MAAVLAVSIATTVNGGLRWDDFGNLRFSRETDVLSYLFNPVFDHFAPGHRLLTLLQYAMGPRNTVAMHLVMSAVQTLAMGGFIMAASRLYGRRAWLAPLTLAVTISTTFLAVELWFAAALHQVPALAAGLWSLYFFLRYRGEAHSRDLFISVMLIVVGLAFVSKVLLFVGAIYLLDQLVLRPTRLSSIPRRTLEEWPLWLAFALPTLAYLMISSGRLAPIQDASSVGSVMAGIRDAWLHRFVPLVVGWDPLSVELVPGAEWLLAITLQGLAATFVYITARRRHDSVGVVTVVVLVALVNGVMTLVIRIDAFGPDVALLYRYWLEPVVLAGLLLPWGVVQPADATAPSVLRSPPPWLSARWAGAASLALILAASTWSAWRMVDDHSAFAAKAWLDDTSAAIESRPEPSLVDDLAPVAWTPIWTLAEMSYLWPEASFEDSPDAQLVVGDQLVQPRYEPFFDVDGASLVTNTLTKIDGGMYPEGRALCSTEGATVEMVLAPSEQRRFGRMAFHGDGEVLFVPLNQFGDPQASRTLLAPPERRSDVLFPMDRWPLATFRLHLLPATDDRPLCIERVSVGVISNAAPVPGHEGP